MKKNFTLLITALTLLTFLISPMAMRGQSDYSADYTGNITLSTTGGSNASDCLVVIDGVEYAGIKAGTSSKAGAVMVSVPSGTKYLHLHVAAWNNSTVSLAVTPEGYSDNIGLTANTGIANNSPFTFNGDPSTGDYYKVVTFSDAMAAETELTFTAVGGKRFVIWGVTAEEEGSSTTTPTLVTIDDTNLTNTDLYQGTAAGYLTATVKTNAGAAISGASVTWSSNNTAVATIDNGGHITLVASGQATITASYAGVPDQYGASHANYQLTVTNSDPDIPGSEDNPYTVEQAREAIDNGLGTQSVYATGIVSQIVTPYNSGYGNITFDISDDGETSSDQLRAYRCVGDEAANVLVGDIVTIFGDLTLYGSTYEFNTGCEIVSLEHTQTIYTITYNPNITGTASVVESYADGTSVTIAGNHFSNPGHAFTGWNTNANGQGVTYMPGDSYVIHSNLVLYAQWIESSDLIDVLNWEATGSPTNYTDWTYTAPSGAEYAGQSSGTYQSIQLRSNNNNSGIVTTVSAGLVTKVSVIWNSNTYDGRVLNIYGSNTAYTAATELYGEDTAGDLIGTIVCGTSTELDITDSYEYIGIRSAGSALYLDEIDITWNTGGTPSPSISANNVEVAYNATSGAIEYTINNAPTPAGVLTASTSSSWLTIGNVGTTVPFTCSVNNDGTSRTATVTLTYTYNSREAVTKNVTVTQAGNPNVTMTIAEARAQQTGAVATKGVVTTITGSNNKTAYIQDATAAIVVFGNFSASVGDEIVVAGTLSDYNGLLEITSPEVTVLSSGNTVTPELMTVAEIVESTNQGWYIRVEEAIVTAISGQNTTITQGDAEIVVRGISGVEYTVNDVISLNGNIGYYNGNQIANPTDVEVQATPTITVNPTELTVNSAEHQGTFNVTYTEINTSVGVQVLWYNAAGSSVSSYNWITATVDATLNIQYTIQANTGDARTAYFKVSGKDSAGNNVYSDIVTVNQTEYEAPGTWVLTDISDLTADDIFVIVGTINSDDATYTYALPNEGNPPLATSISVVDGILSSEPDANLRWNISGDATNGFTFYPNGTTESWLYCSTTQESGSNNNIKVGTGDRKVFVLNEDGYLVTNDEYVARYLSIYVNEGTPQDWRGYINTNSAVEISFYKKTNENSQTLALAEGWNWCSFNVETTLNDLKAALNAALPGTVIIIKQKNGTTSYDPQRNRWIGTITWDLANMYEIKITSSCNITLEGAPINTAELPITIKNGANWIAFPVSESMSLTNAFANIAVNGDIIKSKDGSAIYNRGRWQGSTLTTLEPGQGYLYKSSVSNDRTLIY